MDKQSQLEEIYNAAFNDELEKIALVGAATAVARSTGKESGKKLLNILHEGSGRAYRKGTKTIFSKGSESAVKRSQGRYGLIQKLNRKTYGKLDPRRYLQG